MKKGGGRRYYRPDDIALLSGIRALLYDDGLSIKKAQAELKAQGIGAIAARGRDGVISDAPILAHDDHAPQEFSSDKDAKKAASIAQDQVEDLLDEHSETQDRLNNTLQKLLAARSRLNETLQ
jgi:DNA-binding transcriptional MerR regulator